MNIENKSVLITGANRGIGPALVKEAVRRGAKRVYAGTRGTLQNSDLRVMSLRLDVTNTSQIQQAAREVGALDVLINNAGIAIYDDLSNLETIEQHLDVNLFGMLRVTRAFLPLLEQSKGAIVNNLSLVALAPLPVIPSYSFSKAAAFNMTQSLRALLAGQEVTVHAVVLGPVDTNMNRGFNIPKASPESAQNIFDGLERGEEDIFPDPASLSIAEGWRGGVAKALERQFAALVRRARQVPDDVTTVGERKDGGATMKNDNFTITISVDQSPQEVFAAINNVRGWWSGEIDGDTDKLDAEFTYRYKNVHHSRQRITELVPDKKVVWRVVDSTLSFTEEKSEWNGTDIVFEISKKAGKTEVRFTHKGLVPQYECYSSCSNAWGILINGNLRKLITTGKPQPDAFA